MIPLISVILPVYNAEKYIENCLLSVKNQTYNNIEVIIINDGSSDKSGEIIKKYIINESIFIYYEQKNSGTSMARNFGIKKANGDYIVFVDSDDTLEKEYIEKLSNQVIKLKSDIVTCGYMDISKYGNVYLNDFWEGQSIASKDEFVSKIFKGVGGTLWGKIFKSEIIINNNISINNNITMSEDLVFVLEYAMYCQKFSSIKECLYNYNRLNENSITSKINMNYYNSLILVLKKIEEILKTNGYDRNFIDSILMIRIKNLLVTFLILQYYKNNMYSCKDKIKNMEIIFNNEFFRRYYKILDSKLIKEKILLFLIKNGKKKFIIHYSLLLYFLQTIKEFIGTKVINPRNRLEVHRRRKTFEGNKTSR